MSFFLHVHKIIQLESYLHSCQDEQDRDDKHAVHHTRCNNNKGDNCECNHQCKRNQLFLHLFFVLLLLEWINFVGIGVVCHPLTHLSHQIYYCENKHPNNINKVPV